MLPKFVVIIFGWVLLITCATYLLGLSRVVKLLRNNFPEYWQRIGSPKLSDPNNLTTVFPKVILGLDIPKEAALRYRGILLAVRASLIIFLISFVFMVVMAALGKTPP